MKRVEEREMDSGQTNERTGMESKKGKDRTAVRKLGIVSSN